MDHICNTVRKSEIVIQVATYEAEISLGRQFETTFTWRKGSGELSTQAMFYWIAIQPS